jgi:hypothetical protein
MEEINSINLYYNPEMRQGFFYIRNKKSYIYAIEVSGKEWFQIIIYNTNMIQMIQIMIYNLQRMINIFSKT